MNAYPHYPMRKSESLDGLWDFAFLGDSLPAEAFSPAAISFDDKMSVPLAFDASPRYSGRRGVFAYRRRLSIRAGRRALLRLAGAGMRNLFYLDGTLLQDWRLPYSGGNIELPPSDRTERELIVLSDNRIDREKVPLVDEHYDFYPYGGLFRPLILEELGDSWIDRGRITPLDPTAGTFRLDLSTGGAPLPAGVEPELSLIDEEGKDCPLEVLKSLQTGGRRRLTCRSPRPRLWSPEAPRLYRLRIRLGGDEAVERFGFRTVETEGGQILLNGNPVKLLGVCRHEAHPQFGPALPPSLMLTDLQLLKEMGGNFIRGAHYPQDQRFLDLCDAMGVLVFEETLGWQNRVAHFTSPAFLRDQEEQTRRMARNSFNHPSVILWGFFNEGDSHRSESEAAYARTAEILREEDPSRLISYASNHPLDDRNFTHCDVISVNQYPGWYGEEGAFDSETRPLDEIGSRLEKIIAHFAQSDHGEKPLIISEIGAGAIYGWRDTLRARWTENYQADCLEEVCRKVTRDERICGVALWQFCDCRTYQTGRVLLRPRGFNNKGILDEYRRPKMAFEAVKTIFQEYNRGRHE